MSDVQNGPGWWLASDGKWYPPESAPRPLAPPPVATPPGGTVPYGSVPYGSVPYGSVPYGSVPVQRRSVSTGLGGTIQGFSWTVGALALVSALMAVASLISFNTYWDTPINSRAEDRAYDDWVAIDDGFAAFAGFAVLFGFVLWILLMVWMSSAHKTTQQLWPGDRHWSSGWTVGAWFIPVANAILPKLVLGEIERIALAPRSNAVVPDDSWKARPTLVIGRLWWIALVVGMVANVIGNGIGTDIESSMGAVQASYALNAIGFACIAASGVFGALYIRRVGQRLSADGLQQQP